MADSPIPDSQAPTFRLQTSDSEPTRRVQRNSSDSGEEPTMRVGAAPQTSRRALGYLEKGHLLPRGLSVEATIAPHETARPGVYRCHSALEGRVVVKIAALNAPPDLALWNRLPQLQHPHVLKVTEVFEGENDGFFYEIQEWCEGGTLAEKIAPVGVARDQNMLDWIESALIPAFWSGISYLHAREIIHRDIKPSNLYFRGENEEMVIGDFDISSLLRDGRTSRDTARAAGTWAYAAPEAFPRFMDESGRAGSRVSRASDFYSFGVVLLELLQGTTPLHGGDFPDVFDFYLAGRRLETPPLPQKWRDLLGGLLIRDRHARWGADQIERWMAGQNSDDDRALIASDRGLPVAGIGRPFSAFASRPTTLRELADAMLAEPEIAREELLNSDVLLHWIGEIDAQTARAIRLDRENWRAQNQSEVALLCALLRCNPQTPALIAPEIAAFSALEWSQGAQKAILEGQSDAQTLCHAGALMWLEQWLRLKSPPEIEASDAVSQMRKRREIAEASGAAREIEDETPFLVIQSARTHPSVAKGVRSAGYGRARGFALENEQITPESLAQNCEITPETARRLCAQLERDGVLQRLITSEENPIFEPETQAEVIFEELCYAFEPQKPYFVGLESHARTPQEIAALCLAGKWSEAPPPLFVAACGRWQNGFLEAWLRQRLPLRDGKTNPILLQIEKLRLQAARNPESDENSQNALSWALFDSLLRLFDPKIAPVAVEIHWSSPAILIAPYGKTARRTLNWRVRGPGIALGALELSGARPGLELSQHLICGRAGNVEIVLFGGGDLVAGQNYHAQIAFKSQNARLTQEIAPLAYRTDFPREQTRSRVLTGAAIGAATLGIPRLIVMLGELNRPTTLEKFDFSAIWTQTRAGDFPHLGLICATILLLGAAYGAFRAWLWALRNWGAV